MDNEGIQYKMTKEPVSTNESPLYPLDALEIGTKLDGYLIQSILGRGTFGITYLATEKRLRRSVAIKEYLPIDFVMRDKDSTVHPRTGSNGDFFRYGLESFLKEARTLVKFKHNNIVRVLTYFEQNETAYLVMEYEVGRDLNNYFKEHPRPSERELLAILLPINEGLEIVHRHGFIHRDIKPDNIYIRQNQSPVLLDFGAARDVVKKETNQLTRILTEGYSPYEQTNPAWEGQGRWTDIYALGATLYVAVMGCGPISALERAAAIMKKQEDPYISALKAVNKKYSRPFLAAIDKALEFHPKDRPQSLSEWNRMLKPGSTEIMPPSVTGIINEVKKTVDQPVELEVDIPARKRVQTRRSSLYIAIASVILLIAIVSGYNYWIRIPPPIETFTTIQEDQVVYAFSVAKRACEHYVRSEKIKEKIEKIKKIDSTLTISRTRYIAEAMQKLNQAENGFEKNFSQYSISIFKLRRYPVESIDQAIHYFLQLPDYRSDRAYNVIAGVLTDHVTKGILNAEEWKDDLISISVESGVFE